MTAEPRCVGFIWNLQLPGTCVEAGKRAARTQTAQADFKSFLRAEILDDHIHPWKTVAGIEDMMGSVEMSPVRVAGVHRWALVGTFSTEFSPPNGFGRLSEQAGSGCQHSSTKKRYS